MTDKMKDKELACLFANCFPNTLDTTVLYAKPGDAFIITGDIPAMWLRDSTNQILPYARYLNQSEELTKLFAGLIYRQASQIVSDPFANAHNIDGLTGPSPHTGDATTYPTFGPSRTDAMKPGIFERKYELDSLCAFLKLSRTFYEKTDGSLTQPFLSDTWQAAVTKVLQVFEDMQTSTADDVARPGGAIYQFQRTTSEPTDTLSHGVGNPGMYTGMIRSMFRPSDDATTFPFLVPANAMAVVELRAVAKILRSDAVNATALASRAEKIASEADKGISEHAVMLHRVAGEVYAYEVDGYGNAYFADDANVPSLLSLPYLGYVAADDALYNRTRELVLSPANPWFFKGVAGSGIGGPHIGLNMIWPMSIIMRALTSQDDGEIRQCLELLKATSAGTGLMHESFNKDDVGSFTRPWFAWANSLFGELILKIAEERPSLLF
mmetsp:Transcript_27982/g.54403  ORF Transcript_27982/g.54403 Transcript_27982/m.54403 type:complete len:438 (+) Transcript_27982:1-1314(+)